MIAARAGNIPGLFPGLWVPENPRTTFSVLIRSGLFAPIRTDAKSIKSLFCLVFRPVALAAPAGFEPATLSLEG
jgi:hypothetical protein